MTGVAPVEPRPASSVIPIRSGTSGLEVLYLRRNPDLKFHGGYWVFPGGRIDPADYPADRPEDEEAAARRAAVREAREEAGLDVDEAALRFAIHWTTPVGSPIRFSTWFFAAVVGVSSVRVDGEEILDHEWLSPDAALSSQRSGRMKLAAPTFALTSRLSRFASPGEALTDVERWPRERLLGQIHEVPGGRLAIYSHDHAWNSTRLDGDGPRHRLWMLEGGWRYEREL